ncbi:(d)CMP kinase [Sphingomicrobium astaxanthinifaciens]|uniref:(d)CMP kinase n=1 Tax=Sphingomicrobium astaxanthinifaciens TaxID=1227949 RepID=UPI001FCBE8A7|nr:(d)CMP kinase [Sphingomicrobium astaxanthinifaciens]MCJ7421837.1 (d)CMP kinase [Sphingomicrobium astaxanthinifaciens]
MQDPERLLIAVDGPAASGKGTIARALARHYALPHLDTGMLYRGVALALFRFGGDPGNAFEARRAVDELETIDLSDEELRSEVIGEIASRVSAYPGVREALLKRQRDFAGQGGGAVLDGRDIGTVIAPHATAKLFVTASPEVRAERRFREIERRGIKVHLEEVLADIRARDARDAGRDNAPLVMAADATRLDTSDMGIEEAVERAIACVEAARGNA